MVITSAFILVQVCVYWRKVYVKDIDLLRFVNLNYMLAKVCVYWRKALFQGT